MSQYGMVPYFHAIKEVMRQGKNSSGFHHCCNVNFFLPSKSPTHCFYYLPQRHHRQIFQAHMFPASTLNICFCFFFTIIRPNTLTSILKLHEQASNQQLIQSHSERKELSKNPAPGYFLQCQLLVTCS